MDIQVNTGHDITSSRALIHEVETVVESALARFEERITRVEVHLSGESGGTPSGHAAKRCVMQAQLASESSVTASHQSTSVGKAIGGAAGKLERAVVGTLGRLDGPRRLARGAEPQPG